MMGAKAPPTVTGYSESACKPSQLLCSGGDVAVETCRDREEDEQDANGPGKRLPHPVVCRCARKE